MSDVFIEGTIVCLRVPNIETDVISGNWHQWFNDDNITKYLRHGVFPNTKEKQIAMVASNLAKTDAVHLSIINKVDGKMCGVISLQQIDLLNRIAEIAIVMGNQRYPAGAAFEAMALMTQYGFDKLNLNKIFAGQHVELWKWVNTLELLGYRLEGYLAETSIRYGKINDSVRMGITAHTFYKLLDIRNNKYTSNDIMDLLSKRKKTNMCHKLGKAIQALYEEELN